MSHLSHLLLGGATLFVPPLILHQTGSNVLQAPQLMILKLKNRQADGFWLAEDGFWLAVHLTSTSYEI